MIHPSYQELIATINEGQDLDEAPVVKQTCKTDHRRS